jgi:hypothetical protein
MKLCVVTATTNKAQAQSCINSWGTVDSIVVTNGTADEPYLGTVPAFNKGVREALAMDYDIIACFHDDLEILDPDWAKKVLTHFTRHPSCGLAGFGGAIGLGDSEIYQKPYDPMQLARVGFRSNMTNAEAHGLRSLLPERVAVLDGFSQIGRREFWIGLRQGVAYEPRWYPASTTPNLFKEMEALGVTHHFYDGMLGCYAKRLGWDAWYLPIACHHYGGRTAVGDRGYQQWASQQVEGGDHGFWTKAHEIGYWEFKDVLPIRL